MVEDSITLVFEKSGGRICVRCPEEMTHGFSRILKKHVSSWLVLGEVNVDFDLTKTRTIDSYTLGTLIQTLRMVRERNGSARLLYPDVELSKLFELTGFDRIFEIVNLGKA